ncbi:MAG: ParB/RepB/Spo0J family partition protein [Candidatus Kaiserbacteria bacterium]|nr:ParB/RepB/Spo0J family partition protein [Candidatus Kaiserbacteria bacterium]
MDAIVAKSSSTLVHKPCAFNPVNGASKSSCTSTSHVYSRNSQGCTPSGCKSPWRLCIVCIGQSGEPHVVVDHNSGLCAFHKTHGSNVERQKVKEESVSLGSVTKKAAHTVERVPTAPALAKAQSVEAYSTIPEKMLPPAPALHVAAVSQAVAIIENPKPTLPVVKTKEEGRAILARIKVAVSTSVYEIVDIKRIRPMPNQPRKYFDPDALESLAQSITEAGQFTPGFLRRVPIDKNGCDLELIDGERRWQAMLSGNIPTFRSMILDIEDGDMQFVISVIANFNREGHTTLEIIDAVKSMHENLKIGFVEIGAIIGKHPVYTNNLYGLCRLIPEVRAMLDSKSGDKNSDDMKSRDKNRQLAINVAFDISRVPASEQLNLAQKYLRRELNTHSLREAVVNIAARHGVPIKGRIAHPADQRRMLLRKTDIITQHVSDLESRFGTTSLGVLVGLSHTERSALRNELEAASLKIQNLLQKFERRLLQPAD